MGSDTKDEGKTMIKAMLLRLAKAEGYKPTEYFDKIVKAKERMGLRTGCPCDRGNPDRYCISPLCKSDIEKNGTCHCNCWRKKDVSG